MPPDLAYDLPSLAARLARLPLPARSSEPIARAAVAAVLRDPGGGRDAELLFIRRAEREGDPWSGHMAFPGGRCDQVDATLFATAVRETREEVGLDLDAHGTLLTELPELHAVAHGKRTGLLITPFVFALQHDTPLVFADGEVAEAIWAPFGALARKEGAETMQYTIEGRTLDLPSVRVQDRVVWGLTYRMLETLFEALSH